MDLCLRNYVHLVSHNYIQLSSQFDNCINSEKLDLCKETQGTIIKNNDYTKQHVRQLERAIDLYRENLDKETMTLKTLNDSLSKILQLCQPPKQDAGLSSIRPLSVDLDFFQQHSLNKLKPVVDDKSHYLGMGLLGKNNQVIHTFDTLRDFLQNQPQKSLLLQNGKISCKCIKEQLTPLPGVCSFLSKKDFACSPLHCNFT